jgi:hypothetical protein
MALTFAPCKSLKTIERGRGPKLTPCGPLPAWASKNGYVLHLALVLICTGMP